MRSVKSFCAKIVIGLCRGFASTSDIFSPYPPGRNPDAGDGALGNHGLAGEVDLAIGNRSPLPSKPIYAIP
jgi:hypothetical protein